MNCLLNALKVQESDKQQTFHHWFVFKWAVHYTNIGPRYHNQLIFFSEFFNNPFSPFGGCRLLLSADRSESIASTVPVVISVGPGVSPVECQTSSRADEIRTGRPVIEGMDQFRLPVQMKTSAGEKECSAFELFMCLFPVLILICWVSIQSWTLLFSFVHNFDFDNEWNPSWKLLTSWRQRIFFNLFLI